MQLQFKCSSKYLAIRLFIFSKSFLLSKCSHSFRPSHLRWDVHRHQGFTIFEGRRCNGPHAVRQLHRCLPSRWNDLCWHVEVKKSLIQLIQRLHTDFPKWSGYVVVFQLLQKYVVIQAENAKYTLTQLNRLEEFAYVHVCVCACPYTSKPTDQQKKTFHKAHLYKTFNININQDTRELQPVKASRSMRVTEFGSSKWIKDLQPAKAPVDGFIHKPESWGCDSKMDATFSFELRFEKNGMVTSMTCV